MSTKDLIWLGQDPEHDKMIRAKLKGSGSEKRKMAQQLRRLKEMSEEEAEERGLNLVRDPEASAFQIIKVIKEMLSRDLKDNTKVELIGKMVQAHTAIHGQKTKNVNLNVDMTSDKVIDRLRNWKRQNEEIAVEIISGENEQ